MVDDVNQVHKSNLVRDSHSKEGGFKRGRV